MQTGIKDYERNLSVRSKFKQNLNDLKQPQNHKKKKIRLLCQICNIFTT